MATHQNLDLLSVSLRNPPVAVGRCVSASVVYIPLL